ncbi:MAG: GNAT family N-acetyltransferase [Capsulimonas sp.]|uniref:GNAT family N-acetyltransferase n=1 Tax=Capsulimonas sp. TaxID=2494211 RepID=UPI0032671426
MHILETNRLTIRVFSSDDLDAFAAIEADPDVMRFFASGPRSRETAARAIAWYRTLQEQRGHSFWAVVHKANGRLIGLCGLIPQRVGGVDEIEVAYRLDQSHWGQGFATEAATAVCKWGFEHLDVPRLISIIDPGNIASIRVAEKNGMRPVDQAEYDGKVCHIYAVTRDTEH